MTTPTVVVMCYAPCATCGKRLLAKAMGETDIPKPTDPIYCSVKCAKQARKQSENK